MSSILDFTDYLRKNGEGFYNTRTKNIIPNGTKYKVLTEHRSIYDLNGFCIKDLKKLVADKKLLLKENGSILKGEITNSHIIITICKEVKND